MAYTTIAIKDGAGTTQNMGALQDASGNNQPMVSLDSNRATYRASASFTPQATGAITVISVTGSATKTVRIKRIMLGGTSAANAQTLFALQRTSALGAGGTTVSPTIGKLDTGSAAATAVVSHYTATLKAAGTPVGGALSTFNLYTSVVTTPTVVPSLYMAYPEAGFVAGQALVLRGVADFLEVQSINAGNLSGSTILTYVIEWEEDAS